MSIKQVYSVYDKKAKVFMAPFYSHNDDTARRDLEVAVRNPDSFISQHADDYEVYCVAEYNDADGKFSPFHPVEFKFRVADLRIVAPAAPSVAVPYEVTEDVT